MCRGGVFLDSRSGNGLVVFPDSREGSFLILVMASIVFFVWYLFLIFKVAPASGVVFLRIKFRDGLLS